MPDEPREQAAVEHARVALAQAVRENRRLTAEVTRSATRLQQLLRIHGAGDPRAQQAQAEQTARLRRLEQARETEAEARQALAAAQNRWLERIGSDDLAQLTTDFPLVLFPVRLETRFDPQAAVLKIRVYPDTILAETHDPLLTQSELAAGQSYWRQSWVGDEGESWRELVRQARPPRAAWIVQVTEPVNLADRPNGEPEFPSVELRAGSWDRPPEAFLLPDRWLALAYRQGAEVGRAVSRPVQEPLALGFDPHLPLGAGIDVSGDGLELDPGLAWTVDFARAEEVGMALHLPLDEEDLRQGFDRLLVFGVKSSLTSEQGIAALAALFEGHHYSGGWAFVPQGTPTNNSEITTSPYPPPDPDGRRSFAIERGPNLNADDGDGVRLMKALGIPGNLVAHVEGADRTEQRHAQAMNRALWPITFGYFLEQMMAPHVSEAVIDAARDYFVEVVRGRGPLPAFRLRGQPYGILPAMSLDRWQSRADTSAAERQLVSLLRQLRPIWQEQVDQVPRLGLTPDPDADLLAVLGMDASSREVRVRHLHGPDFQVNLLNFLAIDPARWRRAQLAITRPVLRRVGFPTWDPRILLMNFADRVGRFRHPFVAPAPLSEETDLDTGFGFNYIRWVRQATIRELRDETLPDGQEPPNTLLYLTLRHAKLVELRQRALALQIRFGLASQPERHETELIDIAEGTAGRPTLWQRFEQPIPALTGQTPLGRFLETNDQAPEVGPLVQHRAALQALEVLPTAELERLFTETLDVCSHRLDAWQTSLATRRLQTMRQANPTGVYVGAFGWVEDLRPASGEGLQEKTLPDGRTVRVSAANAGYLLAPSMAQASAAAILRNGHRTRSREGAARYAIDLSSGRVRTALSLLDAVRQGQPLGAVLGYQFERGLHDRRLDWFIEPLRRRFPLVANKAEDSGQAADAVAARNVVDGLALHKKKDKLDLTHPDFFHTGIPPNATERAGVESELQRLDEVLDAVADMLTAESVYQFIRGNTGGANTSLDAMARGIRPPEPAIAQQPISGTVITHRVAVVLGGEVMPVNGWPTEMTPRAQAEPYLDSWAGQLFGDPHRVHCRVRLAPPENDAGEDVTLADLALRPIDILALAQAAIEGSAPLSELDQRVSAVALTRVVSGARVAEILYARAEDWNPDEVRTFPEILELARSLNRLLNAARPLLPKDLVPPEAIPLLPETDLLENETVARVVQARQGLTELAQTLRGAINLSDTGRMEAALRAASLYGIQGAFPPGQPTDNETITLVERAETVQAEIERRLAEAVSASEPVAIARALFGRAFPFLPRFSPAQVDELRQALTAGGGLVSDAPEITQWLYQSARVRPALAEWRKLALLAGVLGAGVGSFDVAQLPHRESAHWVALPFADNARPVPGTLSLVLQRVATPQPEQPWVGLLVDEWSELIPDREQMAGLAFHYDAPSTEPPQAVLIAVPSDDSETWSQASLTATLHETLDLTKIRAVDGELLGVLGQLAPVIYLSTNAANDAVSTDFRSALFAENKET